MRQFVHGLNTTTPEILIKVGESYPDMTIQEKVLNGYIEMLKIDQVSLFLYLLLFYITKIVKYITCSWTKMSILKI